MSRRESVVISVVLGVRCAEGEDETTKSQTVVGEVAGVEGEESRPR